jgi:hypothetical protein
LRDLLKKDVVFRWEDHHRNAFQKIKNSLVKSQVLKFFNPAKNITVSVDASLNGLGACLLQNNLPVSYASKALNDSQKNQAQITKELLAIPPNISDEYFDKIKTATKIDPELQLLSKVILSGWSQNNKTSGLMLDIRAI